MQMEFSSSWNYETIWLLALIEDIFNDTALESLLKNKLKPSATLYKD